jgi:hypothetical protein
VGGLGLECLQKLESTAPRLLELDLNTTFMNAASLVYNEQVFKSKENF